MKRQNRTCAMVGNRSALVRRAEASKLRTRRWLGVFDRLEPRTLLTANVVEYPLGQTGGAASAIISGVGTDTNLYFTLPYSNSIGVYNPVSQGSVQEYPIPTPTNSSGALVSGYSDPVALTAASDGKIYFLEAAASQIGVFDPSKGAVTAEYPLLSTPNAGLTGITTGPDGNIWFTEFNANQIGEFNVTTHAITQYAVPTAAGEPDGITSDPTDGLVWFTEFGTNNVGSINVATHAITDSTAPGSSNLGNAAITFDSKNQTLYFLETQAKLIGTLNPQTNTYGATIAGLNDTNQTDQISTDSSGNVWFTEGVSAQVGILNTSSNTVTKQINAGFNSVPEGVTPGADGNMWYTSNGGLIPVSPSGLAQTAVSIPTTSNGIGVVNNANFTNYTATQIISDANGNLWFTQPGNYSVGEFNTTTHTSTLTFEPSHLAGGSFSGWQPMQMALDTSDGSIWYTIDQQFSTGSKIGKINPATGVLTDVASTPTSGAGAQGIAYNNPSNGKGDGDFYFAEEGAGHLGQINPTTGAISDSRKVPTGESSPYGVVADSNGNIWVTMNGSGTVDRFSPSTGQWLATPIALSGGASSQPEGITIGPDGNLWVAEAGNGKVAVINPNTQTLVTEFTASARGSIADGPDGNVWITQGSAVASITPGTYTIVPYTVPDASPQGVVAGLDGNVYFTGLGTGFPTFFPDIIGAVTTNAASQANALAFTTQPPASVTAGKTFGVVVSVENAAAQVDTFVNNDSPLVGSVTLGLGLNLGGSTLSGTLTAPVINGQAVFSGLSLNNVGTGYTLTANYSGLGTATSNTFNVGLAATRLQVTTEPPSTVADGQTFSVSVSAEDSSGNVDTSYNGPITLALGNNPGKATFNTVTIGASNGVATFPNVSINAIGTDYTLVATTPGGNLTSSASGGFNVVAGAVSQLVITTEPASSATPGSPLSMVIKAEDVNNTLVTAYSGSLTVSLTNNTTGASLLGVVPVNFINGVATVSGLTISKPGIGYTLQASSGAFSMTSTPISITPAPTSQFVLSIQPTGDATAGQQFALTVMAEDAFNNVTTAYTGTIQLSSTDFAVALPSYTFTALDNGVHTFFIALDTAGTQTLTATDVNNTAVTGSLNEMVDPGPTTQLVASATTTPATAGTPVSLTFTAEDAEGNPTPDYTGTVHLTSSDALATLPADYTFSVVDDGSHSFAVTLGTAGIQSVTLTDTSDSTITGSSIVSVSAGPTTQIAVGVTATVTVGKPFKATFTAEDQYGNPTPDYLGTIHVTSTDMNAVLPHDYTFTTSDAGVHLLPVTSGTVGTPSLTATDTSDSTITGTTPLNVATTSTTSLLTTNTPSTIYGQNTKFNVTVGQIAGLPVPTGTVQFAVDGNLLGSPVTLVAGSASAPPLTTLAAGSHTITATYSGDSTYSKGSTNPVVVSVSQAPLTFTVNTLMRTYGAPNPPLTYKVAGYVNGDTASTAFTGSPTLATLATSSSVPGTYVVTISTGSLTSSNYDVSTLIPSTLTVTKAPITVKAGSVTRGYGLSNPSFTYTLSGLVNSDLGDVIQGAPTLTTKAVPGSPAGTYAITVGVGTLSAANYTFSNLVNGTLTVTGQAPAKVGDFDGDGITDLSVFRPSTAQWFIQYSGGGGLNTQFGDPAHGDIAVAADYLGKGKDQLAVFRPATDTWIIQTSPGKIEQVQFGDPKWGDIPVPGDYEGIGKADFAVFRPSTDQWIILLSTGKTEILQFGDPKQGDLPVPGDYNGDGKTDLAVFRPSTDQWFIQYSGGGGLSTQFGDPTQGDLPAPGDYDGDGITDLAVYRPSVGMFIIRESSNNSTILDNYGDPTQNDLPTDAPEDVASMITPQIHDLSIQSTVAPAVSNSLAIAPWSSTDSTTIGTLTTMDPTTTPQRPKSQNLWLTALDELTNEG